MWLVPVAAALTLAVIGPRPAAALPLPELEPLTVELAGDPAVLYSSESGLGPMSGLADELASRHPDLAYSDRLEKAAAACAAALPALDGGPIPHSLLAFAVSWAGCPDAELGVVTVTTSRDGGGDVWTELEHGLDGVLSGFSHLGMAKAPGEDDGGPTWTWVVVLSRRWGVVEAFPRSVASGSAPVLRFGLREGLHEPVVVVLTSEGEVERLAPARDEEGWRVAVALGRAPGEARVEVVADGAAGPRVVALMPVAVDRPSASTWVGVRPPDESWIRTAADAEELLAGLVASTRRRYGLPGLASDPVLGEIAREHSRDMRGRGYVGHVSPDGRGLAERLAAAGYPAVRSAENIAHNRSVLEAHLALLDSPAHRARILTRDMSRLGIGVAIDGNRERSFLVTEVFAEPFRRRPPEDVAADVGRRVAADRRRAGLEELADSSVLDDVAARLARDLVAGRLAAGELVGKAGALLAAEGFGWQRMWVESIRFADIGEVPGVEGATRPAARRVGIGAAVPVEPGARVAAVVLLVAP